MKSLLRLYGLTLALLFSVHLNAQKLNQDLLLNAYHTEDERFVVAEFPEWVLKDKANLYNVNKIQNYIHSALSSLQSDPDYVKLMSLENYLTKGGVHEFDFFNNIDSPLEKTVELNELYAKIAEYLNNIENSPLIEKLGSLNKQSGCDLNDNCFIKKGLEPFTQKPSVFGITISGKFSKALGLHRIPIANLKGLGFSLSVLFLPKAKVIYPVYKTDFDKMDACKNEGLEVLQANDGIPYCVQQEVELGVMFTVHTTLLAYEGAENLTTAKARAGVSGYWGKINSLSKLSGIGVNLSGSANVGGAVSSLGRFLPNNALSALKPLNQSLKVAGINLKAGALLPNQHIAKLNSGGPGQKFSALQDWYIFSQAMVELNSRNTYPHINVLYQQSIPLDSIKVKLPKLSIDFTGGDDN